VCVCVLMLFCVVFNPEPDASWVLTDNGFDIYGVRSVSIIANAHGERLTNANTRIHKCTQNDSQINSNAHINKLQCVCLFVDRTAFVCGSLHICLWVFETPHALPIRKCFFLLQHRPIYSPSDVARPPGDGMQTVTPFRCTFHRGRFKTSDSASSGVTKAEWDGDGVRLESQLSGHVTLLRLLMLG